MLRARDKDEPGTPNSAVQFLLVGAGRGAGQLFTVRAAGRAAARLYPATSLRGHTGNYSLQVEARDGGEPSNAVTTTITVCVQVRSAKMSKTAVHFGYPV